MASLSTGISVERYISTVWLVCHPSITNLRDHWWLINLNLTIDERWWFGVIEEETDRTTEVWRRSRRSEKVVIVRPSTGFNHPSGKNAIGTTDLCHRVVIIDRLWTFFSIVQRCKSKLDWQTGFSFSSFIIWFYTASKRGFKSVQYIEVWICWLL